MTAVRDLKRPITVLTRACDAFRENYRFRLCAIKAAENRGLHKKEGKTLILTLTDAFALLPLPVDPKATQTVAEKVFKGKTKRDAPLFLFFDAACLSLVRLAAGAFSRGDEDAQTVYAKAQTLFEQLLAFDFDAFYRAHSRVDAVLRKRNYLCYARSNAETKDCIRRLVYRYARRAGIRDGDAAKVIGQDELARLQKRRTAVVTTLRVLSFFALFAAALSVCGLLQALFLALPLLLLSGEAVRFAASLIIRPLPVFSLEPGAIRENVVVVSTVLITGEDVVEEQIVRLEKACLQNRNSTGVIFGLLCDLKDAREKITPEEEALIVETKRRVTDLNRVYGDRFCLFFRERQYNENDGVYSGKERKRGAIIDLCRLLVRGENRFCSVVIPRGFIGNTGYLVTLDADTELHSGALEKMYAAMKHPVNRPVIRNGIVVSGCGVLQPRMAPGVDSAGKTPFSTLLAGSAWTGSYASPVFDFYQSVFFKGAFCGKGMIDLGAFDAVIDGAFPDGRILSHDLLEGTRLRCLYMSELTLTDSFPASAASYYKRKHRWLRGDLQALPFAFPHLPFTGGVRQKNPIDGASKYMILSNVFRVFAPVMALLSLFMARTFRESQCAVYLFFSCGYLLFPFAVTLIVSIRNFGRRFYSRVMQEVYRSFLLALYELSALCFDACLSADAILRVIYRSLISHKKMLEWVTAGEEDRRKTGKRAAFASNMKRFFPSFVVSLMLFALSGGGIVRLLSVMFLLFPFVACRLSHPYKKRLPAAGKDKEKIAGEIRKCFSYYERFVTAEEHDLPPDNYREVPSPAVAHRTSPTNVAMYLLSVVCMRDLGQLTLEEMLSRLEKTLATLKKLPRYRGHLYNWYDTRTLEVLGAPFISTVDSGNFVMSLAAVCGALDECDDERAQRLRDGYDGLMRETDFSFLYDEKRKLLSIGCDPVSGNRSEHCYDLLMSEARSAYYYAISRKQIPVECWARLGRPCALRQGRFGVLSWSGTAFEYFMPAFFLPVYENTLQYEALYFAFREQERDRAGKVWGRSESGYFLFDAEMNYQYKAFGCAALAIDSSVKKENVIAPYASFLILPFAAGQSLSNLRRLSSAGADGRHGFYDAIDFSSSRVGGGHAIIRSYMAHHVGMSIVAATNALTDFLTVRRVMRDKELNAFTDLLKEGVPCDEPLWNAKIPPNARPHTPPASAMDRFVQENRSNHLQYEGEMRVTQIGGVLSFSYGELLITPPVLPQKRPRRSFGVAFHPDDPKEQEIVLRQARFDGRQFCLRGGAGDRRVCLFLLTLPCGAVMRLTASARSAGSAVFLFPLVLANAGEYCAHPAFAGLLVESPAAPNNVLLFRRRPTDGKRREAWLLFAFSDGGEFDALTSFDDLPEDETSWKTAPLTRRSGALRLPFAALRRSLPAGGPLDLFMLCGDTKESLFARLAELQKKSAPDKLYQRLQKEIEARRTVFPAPPLPDKLLYAYVSLLLEGASRFRKRRVRLPEEPIGQLWRYGISGDDPIFTFAMKDERCSESVKRILRGLLSARAYLSAGGVQVDLVFLLLDADRYFSQTRKEFMLLTDETAGRGSPGRGGVHLIEDAAAERILPSFSRVFMMIGGNCIKEHFFEEFRSCLDNEPPLQAPSEAEEKTARPREVKVEGESVKVRKRGAPITRIYCGRQFGTLLTHDGLGFTWARSAGEFRLTPFSGDEVQDPRGEELIMTVAGVSRDLCAQCDRTSFGVDCATFSGKLGDLRYDLNVGVHRLFPVKILLLTLKNEGGEKLEATLCCRVFPCLGGVPDGFVTETQAKDAVFYRRTVRRAGPPFVAFVSPASATVALGPGEEKRTVFLLGICHERNDRLFYVMRERFGAPRGAASAFAEYGAFYGAYLSRFSLRTGSSLFERSFSTALPYQTLTSRLWGRAGFYQPGGAYGFRDQLQDALNMLPYDEGPARLQILRCAAHQYAEGDVQHWWHVLLPEEGSDPGVRTKCSDDLLWLPFVTARYVRQTGDESILSLPIRYLDSPLLTDGDSRYERPARTQRKEELYMHCLRALECAAGRKADNGLLLMGSCDWNDGFSEVRGGSVWLTQFFILTVEAFLEIARKEDKAELIGLSGRMREVCARFFDGKKYLRAFFRNGEALGVESAPYCKIDLLPQAFSVFLERNERSERAILEAYKRLYDKDHGIFRLFDPPYRDSAPFPGYLGGYCPGFRENGGQYTHAAIWGAMALLRAGAREEGVSVLENLDPISRYRRRPDLTGDPGAIAADVYSAEGYKGRSGWTQYTGSAGWFLHAVLYELLGFSFFPGGFELHPRLCAAFPDFRLTFRREDCVFEIEGLCVSETPENGGTGKEKERFYLDGRPAACPFRYDGKSHTIRVEICR